MHGGCLRFWPCSPRWRRPPREPLFESRQLTPSGEYTFGIEGPAVDAAGNLYVVNHLAAGDDREGRRRARRARELFAELPAGSIGVSIRFGRDRRMYVADYKKPQHLRVRARRGHAAGLFPFGQIQPAERHGARARRHALCERSELAPPRRPGLAHRAGGRRDRAAATVMASERKLTTTNGIDLSPDEKTLYVAESETREIWAYRIDGAQARGAAAGEEVLRLQPRRHPHRHRRPDLCRAHPERHGRGAGAGRQDRARDRARAPRSRPTSRSAGRTARPSTSRSARAASSRRSASTGRGASSVCSASAGDPACR